MTLCRLRANPKKIRVSIRKFSGYWRVTVTHIETGDFVFATSKSPKKAIDKALGKAEHFEFEGIDLDMSWSYTHPHRKE